MPVVSGHWSQPEPVRPPRGRRRRAGPALPWLAVSAQCRIPKFKVTELELRRSPGHWNGPGLRLGNFK